MTFPKRTILAAALLLGGFQVASAATTRSLVRVETNFGDITIELYGDETPVTVHNFLEYARRNFYDGLIFHRVIDDFMIQAGAYDPNLYDYLAVNPNPSGSDWLTDPEFYHEPNDPIVNEAKTTIKNLRGTIAMARQAAADSATSQFFINHADNPHLDKKTGSAGYAVFGRVLDGMNVVDAIAAVPTHAVGTAFEALPDDPVIIERVVVLFTFDDDSANMGDVDFLGVAAALTRSSEGQGLYDNLSCTDTFTTDTLFGVDVLQWQRSALADAGIEGFTTIFARTQAGQLRVFKHVITNGAGSHTVMEAEDIFETMPLADLLGDRDMSWRLLAGQANLDYLADPNNTLTLDAAGRQRTQQIVATGVDLDALPYHRGLVLVRDEIAAEPNLPASLHWTYYHDSVGRVLDIWNASEDTADPNYLAPTDPNAPVLDRDGWRLAWFGQTQPVFGAYSSDFSGIDFLAANSGALRVYRGQGDYDGLRYLFSCTSEELLNIPCLLIEETAVPEIDRPRVRTWIARDSHNVLWLFKREIGAIVDFEAARAGDILPLEVINDPYLRLIAANFNTVGQTLTSGSGPDQQTVRIEATDASLERWPDYDGELLLTKAFIADPPHDVSYSYYHESTGLVLDLWPQDDPNTPDPNDTGWALAEPAPLTKLKIRLRADQDRFDPDDLFVLSGASGLRSQHWRPGKLFFNVGAWRLVVDTADSRWTQLGRYPVYRFLDKTDDHYVLILLNLRTGDFRAIARNVDLTGTAGPVSVELALGSYYGAGEFTPPRPSDVPALLLRGYQNALTPHWFSFSYDDGPNAYNSYHLLVHGNIASQTNPLNLHDMAVTVMWGSSKTYNLDAGKMQPMGEEKYLYRNPAAKLVYLMIDLKNCRFRLLIRKDHLNAMPQDLRLTIKEGAVTRFDESIRIAN